MNRDLVPLPVGRIRARTPPVITNVILHLKNDLPVVVDLEAMPAGGDLLVTCTNVRTVDGKRPPFVHDRHSTFIFPLEVIRLIEAQRTDRTPARTSKHRNRGPNCCLQ